MNAAVRAAERNAERQRKASEKLAMIYDAEDAVAEWQTQMHELVSIHANPVDDIDWLAIAERREPSVPEKRANNTIQAQQKLDEFTARFWDFLFGGTEARRDKLVQALEAATEQDTAEHQQALEDHHRALAEWQTDKDLAQRLLAGDVEARRDVIAEMQSLTGEAIIGSQIEFRFSAHTIHAVVFAHTSGIVPNFRRKQLQSGRLSESKMPVAEFNELYQDYICSAALRVAGDVFGLIPVDEVYVTCLPEMLNSRTGHLEPTPVLSARFVRKTYRTLNLRGLDPSDAISNFVHSMDFKRSKGFSPIEPLMPLADPKD